MTDRQNEDLDRPWGSIPYLEERELNPIQRMVLDFHKKYGHPVGPYPGPIMESRKDLRIDLIQEEFDELKEALETDDVVKTYDACIDLIWVTVGILVEGGMDMTPGFEEVERSNQSKLGEDGQPIISRGFELDGFPEGKILKGPNYFVPNLAKVLFLMGMDESEMGLDDGSEVQTSAS